MTWTDEEHNDIVKALAMASEVTGADWSQPTCAFVLEELRDCPPMAVLSALRAIARAGGVKLSLGAIRENVEAAESRLRPRSSYEICGHSESTVQLVLAEEARGATLAPWMQRLLADVRANDARAIKPDPAKQITRARSDKPGRYGSD
jgi:hypothetical protein